MIESTSSSRAWASAQGRGALESFVSGEGVWSSRARWSSRDELEGMAKLQSKWPELKGATLRDDVLVVRLEAWRSFGSNVGRARAQLGQ